MISKLLKISLILFIVFIMISCKSEVNAPEPATTQDQELLKFETIESDISLLQNDGMPVFNGDAVFSIGWNEIFRPFNDSSNIKGTAFAVAFGDRQTLVPRFPRFGIDMGTITIGYSGNEVEMHKMFHRRRGVAYSLFRRPFGASDVLLEYIPNTEYTFNVSGSDKFPPLTLSLTSPESLIDITSHNNGDIINPNQDLTITWSGGNQDGRLAIRAMALFPPPQGMGEHMPHPPLPNPHNAFVMILDNNPGQFTITSEQLQLLLSGESTGKIVVDVSQAELGEVEHDGKIIKTAMRNGSGVMLNVE